MGKIGCVIAYILWLPVFNPQITGTGFEPETMNWSLSHWWLTGSGPIIENRSKSNLKNSIRKSI